MKRRTETVFEVLNLLSSAIIIILFLWLLLKSVDYWAAELYVMQKNGAAIEQVAFWVVIMIAFVTVLGEWISGRIISIIRSITNIRRLRENGKKEKTGRSGGRRGRGDGNPRGFTYKGYEIEAIDDSRSDRNRQRNRVRVQAA